MKKPANFYLDPTWEQEITIHDVIKLRHAKKASSKKPYYLFTLKNNIVVNNRPHDNFISQLEEIKNDLINNPNKHE